MGRPPLRGSGGRSCSVGRWATLGDVGSVARALTDVRVLFRDAEDAVDDTRSEFLRHFESPGHIDPRTIDDVLVQVRR